MVASRISLRAHVAEMTPLLIVVLSVVCLLFIPFKILSTGYMPPDDAMRHAAKAVSGKNWSEILVLNPAITIDHHDGWHRLLAGIHRVTGANTDALVSFSIASLFLLFLFSGVSGVKHVEAWVIALLMLLALEGVVIVRWAAGRPYLLSMAYTVLVLQIWGNPTEDRFSIRQLLLTMVGFGIVIWMHGSWYLFALLVGAFLLAGAKRRFVGLLCSWLGGAVLAALLTGRPLAFFYEHVKHLFLSLGADLPARMLVTEFMPSSGSPAVVVMVAVLLLLLFVVQKTPSLVFKQPAFILMLLGWMLGFRVTRFWLDWGIPGFLVWTAWLTDKHMIPYLKQASESRLILVGFVCMALFMNATADRHSRWTQSLHLRVLNAERSQELGDWMPDPGGIVYSDSMQHFYQVFFYHPHGDWRYILGFEPGIMEPQHLQIYRTIQWNLRDFRAFDPWVDMMQPADRLFKTGPEHAAPPIGKLEWRFAADNLWIGRIPRNSDAE